MAITICGNCIGFGGSYTLCSTAPGFGFDGVIKAECGFCDTRTYQGTLSGYHICSHIQKFPFTSDTNSTDVLEMSFSGAAGGHNSNVNGYASSDADPNTSIGKFPFASEDSSTDVGELACGCSHKGNQSSLENGYATGGRKLPAPEVDVIQKFPFSADSPASDIAELVAGRYGSAGQSSSTHGYNTGGEPALGMEKFPFAADSPSTDVGEDRVGNCAKLLFGHSSPTDGYVAGGETCAKDIRKFPFTSDSPSSLIGTLIQGPPSIRLQLAAGISSTTFGYSAGMTSPAFGCSNAIQKHPFSSDTNASDVGDLTLGPSGNGAGVQV